MLIKSKRIYRFRKIIWTYKRPNLKYKSGKVVFVRGNIKCGQCKWNTLVGLECGMYRVILDKKISLFDREINVRTLCLSKSNKAYTVESVKLDEQEEIYL